MDIINAISNNRMAAKHGTKIAWGTAIVCLLISLVYVGLHARSQSILKASNYAPQKLQPIRRANPVNYRANDIVAANLFGNPNPAPVVKQAPPTTLDLTLQGILWDSDGSLGRAIIQSGKKASKLYSVGESIQGAGASVKEIRSGEVLLNRNGATESLPLIKQTSSGNRQVVTFFDPTSEIESPVEGDQPDFQNTVSRTARTRQQDGIRRSTTRQRSPNGEPRKIRKPNFSGLDRALKKMGEL